MEWEELPDQTISSGKTSFIYKFCRCKLPTGWLLKTFNPSQIVFIYDPDHLWIIKNHMELLHVVNSEIPTQIQEFDE